MRTPSVVAVLAPTQDYAAFLEKKRTAILRAGVAAAEFATAMSTLFTLEIDAELEQIAKPPNPPTSFGGDGMTSTPYESMDWEGALIKAQEEVQTWQDRVDNLNAAIAEAPEQLQAIYRVAVLPMSEDSLRSAESRREYVQKMLEQQRPQA